MRTALCYDKKYFYWDFSGEARCLREILLLSCRYLVFHLRGSEAFVDFEHQLVTLVTASSSVKAGNDDFLSAGQEGGPAYSVPGVH